MSGVQGQETASGRKADGRSLRTLVATSEIEVEGRRFPLRYFEHRTSRGARRYSCEVVLDVSDRIILDDDSLPGLELTVVRVVPAMVQSRILAAGPSVAA